jgi:hypothetical protein
MHRVKSVYKQQEVMLKTDARLYIEQFSLSNLFKKYATPSGLLKLDEKTHISSKIMSVLLPILLNSTLLRGSGLITKAIGALVSGKVGKALDAENLSGLFNLIKSAFTGKKKDKQRAFIDYGIPPDSETY